MTPDEPRLTRRIVHISDLVLGAKIDESEARYIPIEDGAFGYARLGVPEGTEIGAEITLVVKCRVVT